MNILSPINIDRYFIRFFSFTVVKAIIIFLIFTAFFYGFEIIFLGHTFGI